MSRARKQATVRKPFKLIPRGSVTVPIYAERTSSKAPKRYRYFRVIYRFAGARVRKSFADIAQATAFAEKIATDIANGQTDYLDETPELRADRRWKANRLAQNEARLKTAGIKKTLEQLVDEEIARHTIPSRTVAQVVADLLASKRNHARSDRHVSDLQHRLDRFAAHFQCPIHSLTQADLANWLGKLKGTGEEPLSGRTRNNYRGALVALFNFAIKTKALPADYEEHRALDRAAVRPQILTWTPDEILLLLQSAQTLFSQRKLQRDLVPYLALGAFAGPRSAELRRMDWIRNVKFESDRIVLERDITKTDRRRQIPIAPNLRAWLAPYQNAHGPICPYRSQYPLHRALRRIAREAGFTWRDNALRHSFISYRVAAGSDIKTVADEAGNSINEIHQSYLELVTKRQALRWFDIFPSHGSQNVLPLFGG
jgi:integrase